jgi:hypothetical protein
MNKSEIEVIQNTIGRLSKDNGKCSGAVEEALNNRNLRIYLDTWVIPSLKLLIEEQRTRRDLELAVDLSR